MKAKQICSVKPVISFSSSLLDVSFRFAVKGKRLEASSVTLKSLCHDYYIVWQMSRGVRFGFDKDFGVESGAFKILLGLMVSIL